LERLNFKHAEVDFSDVDKTISRMNKKWLTYEQTLDKAEDEPFRIEIDT
jgi:hypothetical protein